MELLREEPEAPVTWTYEAWDVHRMLLGGSKVRATLETRVYKLVTVKLWACHRAAVPPGSTAFRAAGCLVKVSEDGSMGDQGVRTLKKG